jgi:hypothetical protein
LQGIEPALNTKQAASFLGVAPGTLAVWRSRRMGPPVHYSGAKPIYRESELREWQRRCTEERLEADSSLLDRQTPSVETKELTS